MITIEDVKTIDKLPINRWQEYRDLTIRATTEGPLTYSTSSEDLAKETEKDWVEELESTAKPDNKKILIFLEKDGRLIGVAGAHGHKNSRFEHNIFLTELYVQPEFRGNGLGQLLIEKRIELMKELVPTLKNIHCEIISTQTSSINLHKKLGFEIVGELKNLVCVDGKYYNEVWMEKILS